MARINNLSNFLTDVATAIKNKKGSETPIPAANFDTEITNLPSQGVYQHKQVTVVDNGSVTVLPDTGYDAIDQLDLTVNIPLQQKTYTFTQNTTTTIIPEQGYAGFSQVNLEIDVQGETPEPTTAEMNDVINPKTFYSNGQKLTGSIMPAYVSLGGIPETYSMSNNGTTICVSPDKKYTIQWGNSFYIYDVKTSQLVKTIAVSNFSGTRRYVSIANVPYEESKYFMYISNTVGGLYVYSYDSEALTITYLHYTSFGHNYNDTIFAMSKEQSNIMAVASRTYIRTYRITTTGVVQISNSGISNERTGSLEFQKHDTILVHNNNNVWDARSSYICCKAQ